jgi:hypothetical protein
MTAGDGRDGAGGGADPGTGAAAGWWWCSGGGGSGCEIGEPASMGPLLRT